MGALKRSQVVTRARHPHLGHGLSGTVGDDDLPLLMLAGRELLCRRCRPCQQEGER
jgi:hypothetical protein